MEGTRPSAGQWRSPTAPGSQWRPAPPPGVWPRLRRGCPGQGATWSGFLVRRAWALGTWNAMGGNGPHCLVTTVCKRQTLSECGSTLFPPRLGGGFLTSLSPSRVPGKRKAQLPPSNATRTLSHFPFNSPARLVLFLPLFYEWGNSTQRG